MPITSAPHLPTHASSVTIKGLDVAFGPRELFRGMTATFPHRQWTCILGASGSGKSTLLRHIAGLRPRGRSNVQGGEVSLLGQVAWMDQHDLLLPWLTAESNVQLGTRLRGEPSNRSRARTLLAATGLAGCETMRPDEMSNGMRQRVALARTLMEDRPVVLMDEPFSAVDALTRLRLQELAAHLLARRTVILVTHDPWEALRLGHRIHVLGGHPATLGEAVIPPGTPPREATSEVLAPLARNLLAQLGSGAT